MGYLQCPHFTEMGYLQYPHFTGMGYIQCSHFTRMRHIQLSHFTRMGHIQWPHFTRMGHIQCPHMIRMGHIQYPHFTRKGHIQCPYFTRMGHIQCPHTKTTTGKPFAQQWILGCHRILTQMLPLPLVESKLGGIGFTMSSRQMMFYTGHCTSLCSEYKHYGPPFILLKWGIFQCPPFD